MRPLNRVAPGLPVGAVKTYQILSPVSTHTRKATCDEVLCRALRLGWKSFIDERTDQGAAQAYYIRHQSGRSFREERNEHGVTVFAFPPGQRCFDSDRHRVPLDRPEIYRVRGGDWRADTGLIRQHTRPELWVEDFAEHQDQIATRINRG